GPGGTPARTRRCARAGPAWLGGRPSCRGRSDRQALAALVAPALERQAPGACGHPGPEPVGAGALALLGLIGPLHGRPRIPRGVLHTSSTAVPTTAPGRFPRSVRTGTGEPLQPRRRRGTLRASAPVDGDAAPASS